MGIRTLVYGHVKKTGLREALGPFPSGTGTRQALTPGSPLRFGQGVCGAG